MTEALPVSPLEILTYFEDNDIFKDTSKALELLNDFCNTKGITANAKLSASAKDFQPGNPSHSLQGGLIQPEYSDWDSASDMSSEEEIPEEEPYWKMLDQVLYLATEPGTPRIRSVHEDMARAEIVVLDCLGISRRVPLSEFGNEILSILRSHVPKEHEDTSDSFVLPSSLRVKTFRERCELLRELRKMEPALPVPYSLTYEEENATLWWHGVELVCCQVSKPKGKSSRYPFSPGSCKARKAARHAEHMYRKTGRLWFGSLYNPTPLCRTVKPTPTTGRGFKQVPRNLFEVLDSESSTE